MALIKYVGKKELQIDTLYGSHVHWDGEGDVKEVPDGIVPLLLNHPDCYERVVDAVSSTPPSVPTAATVSDRKDQIVSVIKGLDSTDESVWTKAGKPDVRVIESVLGYKITSEQRDDALAVIDSEDSL